MEQPLVDGFRQRVDRLIIEGDALRARVADTGATDSASLAAMSAWQQQCGVAVNELSGGSKAHWLARAFSEAFLVRPVPGDPVEEASVTEIVSRLIEVLQQADQALARTDDAVLTQEASQPRRFDFVHNLALRPVLERAYADARSAFDRGDFGSSLVTACGLLESILTDALESTGQRVHHLTFDARIAAAEQAGMIKSECARLPPAAHHYRELSGAHGDLPQDVVVTARDARAVIQVLQMVMRDLNPGR